MEILNLTPHEVTLLDFDDSVLMRIPSTGLARVSTESVVVGVVNGIPLTHTTYGEVEGLPEQREDVLLIVSGLIRSACPDRTDLCQPGLQVRDGEGRVIGCRSLDM